MIKNYKKCPKCNFHSYLCKGGYYICTNKDCKFKEEKCKTY